MQICSFANLHPPSVPRPLIAVLKRAEVGRIADVVVVDVRQPYAGVDRTAAGLEGKPPKSDTWFFSLIFLVFAVGLRAWPSICKP
ncbi:MAG: hypothetical protein ACQESR_29095 [Planctomycetota bacterium]